MRSQVGMGAEMKIHRNSCNIMCLWQVPLVLALILATAGANFSPAHATDETVLDLRGVELTTVATIVDGFNATMAKPFPYKASNLTVERIIGEFSKKISVPVRLHGSMLTRIDVDNATGTVEDFLSQLSSVSEIAWWYDGAAYHFELNSEVTNDVVETRGYPVDRLAERIRELGIVNRPFPFRQSADGALLYIAGPKKYVETTTDLARRLVALRMRRGSGEEVQILPRVYVGGPTIEQRKDQ